MSESGGNPEQKDSSSSGGGGGGGGGSVTITSTASTITVGGTTSAPTLDVVPTEFVNTVSTSGASQTIPDPSVSGHASFNKITLTAACTLTFPTPSGVCSFTLELIQDGTGGRIVTWPTLKWAGKAGPPTLSVAAAAIDLFTFTYDGAGWLAFASGLNMG